MSSTEKHCPSAATDAPRARIFAIVAGTARSPRAHYLAEPLELTPELTAAAAPAHPTEVFRFHARCAGAGCGHHDGRTGRCALIERIVTRRPEVTVELPPCAIRAHCLWWDQEGAGACRRCPQIVTTTPLARAAAAEHGVATAGRGEP